MVDGKVLYSNNDRLDVNNILKFLLMDDKYQNYKKEIEKINQELRSIFEKNNIHSKLEH